MRGGISLSPALADLSHVWCFPFGYQHVPAAIAVMGAFSMRASSPCRASVHRVADAQTALMYLHHAAAGAPSVYIELTQVDSVFAE
jgi:hypothetical protein